MNEAVFKMEQFYTGLSYGFHDASKTIVTSDGDIIYAGHSERYSRIKNDSKLHADMPQNQGTVVFYEKPFKKSLRRIISHGEFEFPKLHWNTIDHHWSHAAAAYYTRPFKEEPVCVVVDAIGEFDTASIWYRKKKVWSMKYPKSLGLFYSSVTQAIGLKPMEDEYITMGMAGYGRTNIDLSEYVYKDHLYSSDFPKTSHENLALSAQITLEKELFKIMDIAKQYSDYLCYGGGVALNCVANSRIRPMFKDMWILPNPSDAGSSLGCVAAYLDKPLNWVDPYLGYNIDRQLNPRKVVNHLLSDPVCGIANGRAEFGPRALGNRSLIADPRLPLKATINNIKQRQQFRPFAPAILEEFATDYFEGPMNEYMQYVAYAKHDYSSVTHVDGTARVQVVKRDCKSGLRKILEEWYDATRCPMLLNTSLNIKGQPMVNSWADALEFQTKYKVKVF